MLIAPGCRSMSTVMNTGASVSPSVFVHPLANASVAGDGQRCDVFFFMSVLPYDRRIRGVMKISSSSCFSVRVLFRNRLPRTGIFQRPGIMLFWS